MTCVDSPGEGADEADALLDLWTKLTAEASRSNGIDKATPSDAPKQNPADMEDRKHQASRRQPWI